MLTFAQGEDFVSRRVSLTSGSHSWDTGWGRGGETVMAETGTGPRSLGFNLRAPQPQSGLAREGTEGWGAGTF